MSYGHGIEVIPKKTPRQPVQSLSAIQVVFGTSPVHLTADPSAAVNKPMVVQSLEDVKKKCGYNADFDKYTLNHSAFANFELFNVSPVVFVNVLDPQVHKTAVPDQAVTITKGTALIDVEGVLLNTVVVKSSDKLTTYAKNIDYIVSFNEEGKPVIAVISTGTIGAATALSVSFSKLNPEAVTEADIIGGYDAVTGKYSGIELIRNVYLQSNLLAAQLLAPGWSHKPAVAAVLNAKSEKINGSFNVMNILDVDSSTVTKFEDVEEWKTANGYNGKNSIALWPMVKAKGKKLWYSAVAAARIAQTDAENEGVPFKSPSNKALPIEATVLADGKEVLLDLPDANTLNGAGIVTAINFGGWKLWGNNTAAYPELTDPEDRFIPVRRVLHWWGNTFILAYFDKVDDPGDKRLIENLVDAENIRANGFAGKGQIAGAEIEYRESMNPIENIINGKIVFIQRIGAFSPAEKIETHLEFDPNLVAQALGGE